MKTILNNMSAYLESIERAQFAQVKLKMNTTSFSNLGKTNQKDREIQ